MSRRVRAAPEHLQRPLVMSVLSRPSAIFFTSRSMSAWDASLLVSWITAIPPLRRTRYISARALFGCVKFLKAAWQTIRSTDAASNGILAASAPAEVDAHRRLPGIFAGDLHEREPRRERNRAARPAGGVAAPFGGRPATALDILLDGVESRVSSRR